MSLNRLQHIIIEHDPQDLFDSEPGEDDLDREATVCEYDVSLGLYLAETFSPIGVEVTPIADLRQTYIHIEPDPADPAQANHLRAAIEAAIDEHYERGDFWVEAE